MSKYRVNGTAGAGMEQLTNKELGSDCPNCHSKKHQLKACNKCGFSHLAKTYKKSLDNSQKPTVFTKGESTIQKTVSINTKVTTDRITTIRTFQEIKLVSKRGTIIHGRFKCTNCGNVVDNPMRYSQTNIGVVILCASCKSSIKMNSFPEKHYDALDLAKTGGMFEGNRSRH